MQKPTKKQKVKYYILLHAVLLVLSLSAVCSKQAAQYEWFSLKWCFFYGLVLLIMFIYAFAWQLILKGLPLTVAFSNKAITIFWGMLWGAILFGENINLRMIIAAAIIFTGIIIISTDKSETAKDSEVIDLE